ncbi:MULTISPECIES: hypothetical protein [unclassified Actinomyces]|jgi:hypothetical protein|uniref:hypothetical protein n=1 Tax=unclassified Actinomyces TaxID=2609248 RepID=UPI000D032A5B|nr:MULTISPECIES: hypothetical protein [unclassified Actinomyces]AVM61217.1 hypothetical protein C3V41_03035 [Actinomyces sp. oral taxon 897]QQO77905.1 hypothetical protein JJJ15_00450 [Actinomyces sp. HMT897]
MSVDWASLGLVTGVTVLGTSFILVICASAVRLLGQIHLKRRAGEVQGLHAAEVAAGFFILCVVAIALFGLWLLIPYFH